ncbi:hypothetical protein GGF46_001738 [Coemansia sp. RSA 552]|nr:hypothetical protein GGF46_001738 [Coemansia sp. RSA 552]
MDNRGNKDTSNFFSRIKNVDVLRSPYPRHLAQGNRRQPAMAASARPIISSGMSSYGPMRPSPVHAVASPWQAPVARPGSASISPIGGGIQSRVVQHAQGLYQSPPRCPSSAQPLRVHPQPNNGYRHIPGSTLPAHIPGGPSGIRNLSSSTSNCILHNWFVCLDTGRKTVTISGSYTKFNGTVVMRHSSPIEGVFDERLLRGRSSTIYQLMGPPDTEMMRARGLPSYLADVFDNGFPRNWRQLVEEYLGTPLGPDSRLGSRSGGVHRGEMTPRPAQSAVHSGYPPERYQFASPAGRFGAISESSEVAAEQPQYLPPDTYNHPGHARMQQRDPPDASRRPVNNQHTPIYRDGADIFANGRFAQAATPRTRNKSEESVQVPVAMQPSSREPTAEYASGDDGYGDGNVLPTARATGGRPSSAASMASEVADGIPNLEVADGIPNLSLETPTKAPVHSSGSLLDSSNSVSPDLCATRGSQSEAPKIPRVNGVDDMDPFKLDDAEQSEAEADPGSVPEPEPEHESMPEPKPKSADTDNEKPTEPVVAKAAPKKQPGVKPRAKKVSRRAVASSSESQSEAAAAEDTAATNSDAGESGSSAPADSLLKPAQTQFRARRTGPKAAETAKTARRASGTATPVPSRRRAKTPGSAPAGRAKKGGSGLKRQSSGSKSAEEEEADVAKQTPTRARATKGSKAAKGDLKASGPLVIIEVRGQQPPTTDSGRESESSAAERPVATPQRKRLRKKADVGTPDKQAEAAAESTEPAADKAADTQSAAEDGTPGEAEALKTPQKTPTKWKIVTGSFRYRKPKVTTPSVTRSGRKVQQPREWWADAQEHLTSPHKQSNLKYRWGTGDAVVVKDGKRIRLSDMYKEDSDADPLHDDASAAEADQSGTSEN